jgi:hypothetical protein
VESLAAEAKPLVLLIPVEHVLDTILENFHLNQILDRADENELDLSHILLL